MRFTIRLYSPHDIDLIALLYRRSFDLASEFRETLYSYVRGDEYIVSIPGEYAEPDYIHRNPHVFHVVIDSSDRDVIEFLNRLPNGYRNATIKNIFRQKMSHPYVPDRTSVPKRSKPKQDRVHPLEPKDALTNIEGKKGPAVIAVPSVQPVHMAQEDSSAETSDIEDAVDAMQNLF